MTLSDTRIRGLKPRDKIYRLADAHGLCLEVTPSGSRLWRYRYRWAGRATMLSLGPYPIVGLAEARSEEHTSELQSLMRISYAVFCLKKKKTKYNYTYYITTTILI